MQKDKTGNQCWEPILGSNSEKSYWEEIIRKQCYKAILVSNTKSNTGKHCWEAMLGSNAGKQYSEAILGSSAGKQYWDTDSLVLEVM